MVEEVCSMLTDLCSMLTELWRGRPAKRGMRVDVMYRGKASVHHSSDTNASSAAQFCSCGFLNMGIFISVAARQCWLVWTNAWMHKAYRYVSGWLDTGFGYLPGCDRYSKKAILTSVVAGAMMMSITTHTYSLMTTCQLWLIGSGTTASAICMLCQRGKKRDKKGLYLSVIITGAF